MRKQKGDNRNRNKGINGKIALLLIIVLVFSMFPIMSMASMEGIEQPEDENPISNLDEEKTDESSQKQQEEKQEDKVTNTESKKSKIRAQESVDDYYYSSAPSTELFNKLITEYEKDPANNPFPRWKQQIVKTLVPDGYISIYVRHDDGNYYTLCPWPYDKIKDRESGQNIKDYTEAVIKLFEDNTDDTIRLQKALSLDSNTLKSKGYVSVSDNLIYTAEGQLPSQEYNRVNYHTLEKTKTAEVINENQLTSALEDSTINKIVFVYDMTLTKTHTINRNISIEGKSSIKTVKTNKPLNNSMFNVVDGAKLTLERLTFDGSGASNTSAVTVNRGGTLVTPSVPANRQVTFEKFNGKSAVTLNGGSAKLQSAVFQNNTVQNGPAVNVANSQDVQLLNCKFINNTASGNGGAVYVYNTNTSSVINISGSIFQENSAQNGGALCLWGQNVGIKVVGNQTAQFKKNKANRYGGGIYALACSDLTLIGLNMDNNEGVERGGAIYINGNTNAKDKFTIKDSRLGTNKSKFGGAVYSFSLAEYNSMNTKYYVTLGNVGNTATNNGGAIYFDKTYNIDIAATANSFESVFSSNQAGNDGGAIFVGGEINKVTMNLRHLSFQNNQSAGQNGGGAVYASSINNKKMDLNIISTSFERNKSINQVANGGALTVLGDSTANCEMNLDISGNSSFKDNSSNNLGGAIRFVGGGNGTEKSSMNVAVKDTTFNGNSARLRGGAIYGAFSNSFDVVNSNFTKNFTDEAQSSTLGGGMWLQDIKDFDLNKCNMIENKSSRGGGVYIQEYAYKNCQLDINDSNIDKNDSLYGSGIYAGKGTFNINNTSISGNTAQNAGAAIYNNGGSINVVKAEITSNSSVGNAGAIFIAENSGCKVSESNISQNKAQFGGGFTNNNGTLEINNSTVSNNVANEGGGIYTTTYGGLKTSNVDFNKNNKADRGSNLEQAAKYSDSHKELINIHNRNMKNYKNISGNYVYTYNNHDVNFSLGIKNVDFETNGGTSVSAMSVSQYDLIAKPHDPIRGTSKFVGWFEDSSLSKTWNFSNPIIDDMTLYGKWLNRYDVIYNADEDNVMDVPKASFGYEEEQYKLSGVAPRRAGYSFTGWLSSHDGKVYSSGQSLKMPSNHIILTATWNKVIPKTYNLKYNRNHSSSDNSTYSGGTYTTSTKVTLLNNGDIENLKWTKKGYKFKGWSASRSGKPVIGSYTVSKDITLYAIWEKEPKTTIDKPEPSKPGTNNTVTNNNERTIYRTIGRTYTNMTDNRSTTPEDTGISQRNIEQDPQGSTIEKGQVPLQNTSSNGSWALLNLIMTVAGLVILLLIMTKAFMNKRNEEGEEQTVFRPIAFLASGIMAIAGLLVFILTQDLTLNMTLVDNFTLINLIILLAEMAGAFFTFKKEDSEQRYADF